MDDKETLRTATGQRGTGRKHGASSAKPPYIIGSYLLVVGEVLVLIGIAVVTEHVPEFLGNILVPENSDLAVGLTLILAYVFLAGPAGTALAVAGMVLLTQDVLRENREARGWLVVGWTIVVALFVLGTIAFLNSGWV